MHIPYSNISYYSLLVINLLILIVIVQISQQMNWKMHDSIQVCVVSVLKKLNIE